MGRLRLAAGLAAFPRRQARLRPATPARARRLELCLLVLARQPGRPSWWRRPRSWRPAASTAAARAAAAGRRQDRLGTGCRATPDRPRHGRPPVEEASPEVVGQRAGRRVAPPRGQVPLPCERLPPGRDGMAGQTDRKRGGRSAAPARRSVPAVFAGRRASIS